MIENIQLVILEGRACNRFLRQWAARFRHRRILNVSDFQDHVAAHRNRVFKWFRDACELPWLLMMDDDMVPVPETQPLLSCEGDVVGARAWGKSGTEAHPHAFSMAAVKVHRRVVEAIDPPWFGFTFSPDGTRQEMCECLYFHQKAVTAGFEIKQAGTVGHRFPVTVVPDEEGARFLFDGDVERENSSR